MFWSGNYIAGNILVRHMPPLWMTFSRWLLTALLLLPLVYWLERPDWRALVREWRRLAVGAFFGMIAYNLALYSALSYTTPLNATLVNSFSPSAIALVSVFLLGEKLSPRQALGVFLSLAGVVVVIAKGDIAVLRALAFNPGDLLMVLAVLSWVAYTVVIKRLPVPPLSALFAMTLTASAMLLPFAAWQGVNPAWAERTVGWALAYIVVFPSVCSYIFWTLGVRAVGAAKSGIFQNLMPVFTALISLPLGGQVEGAQLAGGALVFLGVCCTTGMLARK